MQNIRRNNGTKLGLWISFVKFVFLETVNNYCLAKKGVEATFPFDEETLVWKVMGKMFCLGDVHSFTDITLKCDPEESIQLQARYENIRPGYHMNKKLWITIKLDGLPIDFVFSLIDTSYELVVRKLPLKEKHLLQTL
jgi:predicted DNA-binding protein (MmcQ/YjbR family)